MDLLHQLLTALLRQLGEGQADAAAVILGINAQIGVLDGLLNALQGLAVPGRDDQGPGIGRGDGRDLLDGGGAAVVVHHNAVQHSGVGTARTHGSEVRGNGVNALLHFLLVYFVLVLQHNGSFLSHVCNVWEALTRKITLERWCLPFHRTGPG